MIKNKFAVIIGLLLSSSFTHAQVSVNSPYVLKSSEEFKSPKGFKLLECQGFGKDGIVQFSSKKLNSFAFQKFSTDMKLIKENVVNTESRFVENSRMLYLSKVDKKSYLFTSDEFSLSALEFLPDKLDFDGKSSELFKPSDKVRSSFTKVNSNDESKCMFYYSLKPKIKRDALSKEIIGFQVFDANLKKIWGGEFEMPYSEAKMDILDYTLADDGKVYLSAKVFKTDSQREKTKDGEVNYNFEVFVFQKDMKQPKTVSISVDGKFPTWASIFEDVNHNILIAGFYSKVANGDVEGAYAIKLDVESAKMTKVNGGYFEIPTAVIKQNTRLGEQKRLDKKEAKGKDVGLRNLIIKNIYTMPNGSVKIIAEEYVVIATTNYNGKTTTTTYSTYAEDLYVFSIDTKGSMEWIKKIPKYQYSSGSVGPAISIKTLAVGNDLHIFYLDDVENDKILKTNAPPARYGAHRGGYLIGNMIDSKGNVTRYDLGDVKVYKTNFFIRYFDRGGNNNLISTERRKRNNILFSLQVK